MTGPEIVIENLTKEFEDVTAADGLSLEIEKARGRVHYRYEDFYKEILTIFLLSKRFKASKNSLFFLPVSL